MHARWQPKTRPRRDQRGKPGHKWLTFHGCFRKQWKKFVSAILVNLSYSIFNIYPENTSLATGNRQQSQILSSAFIEYRYFGKKRCFCVSLEFFTINLPYISSLSLSFSFFFSLSLRLPRPLFSCLLDSPASSFPKSFLVFSHSCAGRGTKSREVRDWTMNAGRRNDERESKKE